MRRDLQPVGEIFVSYEAKQMPTDVLARLTEDAIDGVRSGEASAKQTAHLLGWLCRIALHKIRALEGSP